MIVHESVSETSLLKISVGFQALFLKREQLINSLPFYPFSLKYKIISIHCNQHYIKIKKLSSGRLP